MMKQNGSKNPNESKFGFLRVGLLIGIPAVVILQLILASKIF